MTDEAAEAVANALYAIATSLDGVKDAIRLLAVEYSACTDVRSSANAETFGVLGDKLASALGRLDP